MIDWLFRNRRTGQITIAQVPNAPLIVFIVAAGVRWIFRPGGALGAIVGAVATLAVVVWAVAELLSGVNPWRRILGGVVLGFTVLGLLTR